MRWSWRSLPRQTPLERVIEVLNAGLLALENALGRTPLYRAGRIISAAQVLLGTDDTVLVDTTGGNLTVTLPDARSNVGRVLVIGKTVAGNTLTVDTLGSDEVEGASSVNWTTAGESRWYQSILDTTTGETHWHRIG